MFQFPAFALAGLCIRPGVTGGCPAAFPHSEIPGSTPVCRLPGAYRRLPRPSSPLDAKTSTMHPSELGHRPRPPTRPPGSGKRVGRGAASSRWQRPRRLLLSGGALFSLFAEKVPDDNPPDGKHSVGDPTPGTVMGPLEPAGTRAMQGRVSFGDQRPSRARTARRNVAAAADEPGPLGP